MIRPFFALVLVACTVAGHAQFVSPTPTAPVDTRSQAVDAALLQSLLHAPYPGLLLRGDDSVSVQVYGVKDYSLTRRISSTGTISLPLIGDVPAAGFTMDELEKSIAAKLQTAGMIEFPQVTVSAVALPSDIVTVSGEVVKPGVFPATGQLTLIDYISLAGGFARATNVSGPGSIVVTLIRPSLAAPVTVPLGPDPTKSPYARIPVFFGDEIRVGTTGLVYAVGAFKTQGAFPLKSSSPTTVMQLAALAGGIGFEADYGDAHIVRSTETGHVLLGVNVGKILRGKAPDVVLQQDDILFVPTNQLKAAIKGGGVGIVIGLAQGLLYYH